MVLDDVLEVVAGAYTRLPGEHPREVMVQRRVPGRALSLILWGLVSQGLASGSEMVIHFTTVQNVLARQVFTQDGRKYLRGTPGAKCSYACLQCPEIGGDGGLLSVKTRFSGRSALNVFGKCVGLCDSFEVSIRAMPYYQNGFCG